MSPSLFVKLLAIFAVIALGWVAGRTRMFGPGAATTLGAATFGLFAPALLFRTTAHVALARLPWAVIVAYYAPGVAVLLIVYSWQRLRRPAEPAVPAIRALCMSFSNTVQLGIPVATALFGAAGLAIHLTLASLQALILLTTSTVLVEIDVARGGADRDAPAPGEHPVAVARPQTRRSRRLALIRRTAAISARRALIHPVVLPVLLGLAYNLSGLGIPGPADQVLATLGQAVVPVSLVTIGLTLAQYGITGALAQAGALSLGKVVVQPAVVFAMAYWVLGLRGLPLDVVVVCAGLPIGSNVLLFAQRYDVLQAETTAAIVTSTLSFLVTGSLWLVLLSHLAR